MSRMTFQLRKPKGLTLFLTPHYNFLSSKYNKVIYSLMNSTKAFGDLPELSRHFNILLNLNAETSILQTIFKEISELALVI